ncbi:hypothetical protein AB0H07_39015 [Streptomyces sp. NPDC021354]|uniref:hypothetical protein n=1 Tax=Streptomyces sp. NPDC021354 TaxID=3154793 RepID=UPI003411957E
MPDTTGIEWTDATLTTGCEKVSPGCGPMNGRVYLERGEPVTVITTYCARRAPNIPGDWLHFRWPGKRPAAGPRNVAIRRADGSAVVRPFRGLARAAKPPTLPTPTTGSSRPPHNRRTNP